MREDEITKTQRLEEEVEVENVTIYGRYDDWNRDYLVTIMLSFEVLRDFEPVPLTNSVIWERSFSTAGTASKWYRDLLDAIYRGDFRDTVNAYLENLTPRVDWEDEEVNDGVPVL